VSPQALVARLVLLALVPLADVRGGDLLEAEGWPADRGRAAGADLDGDGRPNDLHWPALPVIVYESPRLPATWALAWRAAADQLELELARTVFLDAGPADELTRIRVEVGGGQPVNGLYVSGSGEDPRHGTTTLSRWPDGQIRTAVIELPAAGAPPDRAARVALHEALHALGLGHDASARSIMHPTAGPTLPRATIVLLRRVYR
jgi:hypothetical protein